jgi:thiamine kinase-like enzyme
LALAEALSSTPEEILQSAAKRVAALPIWRGPVRPEPLGGGLSNTNFLVADGRSRCVVRIGDDVPVHGVVRTNEAAASRAAHAAGVAPEVLHWEPGALVLAFVEGRTLTPADIRGPANLDGIIEILRRCHWQIPQHLRGPALFFWVFHAIRDYGHTLAASNGRHMTRLPGLLASAERLERAIGPVELVFGHNDLLAANFIDDGDRLWLVDWEYAGFNSPLFDLGGLASNSEMPPPLRERLLEAYFDGPVTDELRLRYTAMLAASLIREAMWSMVAELHSGISYDYAAYTDSNLARYEAAMRDYIDMDGK